MRVLWVGHFTPHPPRGGAPQRSFNLLREAAAHAEVHFAGISLRGHQPRRSDVARAQSALSEFCASVRLLPVRLRSSISGKTWTVLEALATGQSYNGAWLACGKSRRFVRAALAGINPDVVHVDSVMIADLLPTSFAGAAVLNHHNVESHMMARRAAERSGPAGAFLRREARLLERLERRSAPRFRRHLLVSELDARRLQQIAPEARCRIVANGVDVDYFRPLAAPHETATLVFAGRMNWYPNDHAMRRFLAELWPDIRRQRPDARLLIVGMNPTRKLLAAAAGDASVRITGFVEDVRPLISASTLYVCPILDGGGTRLKLLDAMAMGQAIVATPLAGEGLEVRDGDEMVIREFGAPLVRAIIELLDRPEGRAVLGERARQRAVATYAWGRIGLDLVAAYREAAEERAASPAP